MRDDAGGAAFLRDDVHADRGRPRLRAGRRAAGRRGSDHQRDDGAAVLRQRESARPAHWWQGGRRGRARHQVHEPPRRGAANALHAGGRGWSVADVRFALHTDRDVATLAGAIRRAVADAGVGRDVTAIESIGEIADATLARERLLAELATSFGLLALLLACIGLYGTMSFAVTRRTSEIGIRMALGANRAAIVGQLMRESGMTIAVGAAAGVAGTFAVARLLSRLLFGLEPYDPATIGVAVLLLGIAAAVPASLASETGESGSIPSLR